MLKLFDTKYAVPMRKMNDDFRIVKYVFIHTSTIIDNRSNDFALLATENIHSSFILTEKKKND